MHETAIDPSPRTAAHVPRILIVRPTLGGASYLSGDARMRKAGWLSSEQLRAGGGCET